MAAAEAGTAEIEPAEPEPAKSGPEPRPAETASIEAGAAVSDPSPAEAAEQKSDLSILEKLPVPVLVHSGDTLHYANHEFFALTGYRSIEQLAEAGGIGALFADPYGDDADYESNHGPRAKTDRQMRLKTETAGSSRSRPSCSRCRGTPARRCCSCCHEQRKAHLLPASRR